LRAENLRNNAGIRIKGSTTDLGIPLNNQNVLAFKRGFLFLRREALLVKSLVNKKEK
jgi:hypothetical protein